MHALHRPHLPRAITITLAAAALAIVLTLAIATGLNDLATTPAPTAAAGTPTALQAPASVPRWSLSPFSPLLSGPVAVPWAPAQP